MSGRSTAAKRAVLAALVVVASLSTAGCGDHQAAEKSPPAPSLSPTPLAPGALQMCASLAKARQHREAGEEASANIETDQALIDAAKSEVPELAAIAGRVSGPDDWDKLAPLLRDWCMKHGVTV